MSLDNRGTVPGWVGREPFLDENSTNFAGKPTLINRGVFNGYSMPEYQVGEELLFRARVPHRWDGVTNPYFVAITSTTVEEDIGDKYKFQFEWASGDIGSVIPDTISETLTCQVECECCNAFYARIISFNLDASTIVSGQNIQSRLRRIAADAPSVSNEIAVWHWDTRWKIDNYASVNPMGYP